MSDRNDQVSDNPAPQHVRLGYATNAFPGETLAELEAAVEGPLRRINESLGEGIPLGLEMRLSMSAASAISADGRLLKRLTDHLETAGLSVITFNGFSPRDFHSRRVKEDAYRPTWLEDERSIYSRMVGEIFSKMLPNGASGSMSTSPGSFKAFGHSNELLIAIAEAYAETAYELSELEARNGRRILLSIEPEPGCTIETTREFLDFYEDYLLIAGRRHLESSHGRSRHDAEGLIRRHLAITFDTSHQAVQFEDLADSARLLAGAGIHIGKVHATSAMRVVRPSENADALAELSRFSSSPYMHQAVGVNADGLVTLPPTDLLVLLAEPERMRSCEELRVHFHLPLYLDRVGALETTAADARAAVRHIIDRGLCDTVILETYTWKVLEHFSGLADQGIEAAIAGEIRWAQEHILPPLTASSAGSPSALSPARKSPERS